VIPWFAALERRALYTGTRDHSDTRAPAYHAVMFLTRHLLEHLPGQESAQTKEEAKRIVAGRPLSDPRGGIRQAALGRLGSIRRAIRRPTLPGVAIAILYLVLVALAGVGVGVGTVAVEGALTALFLVFIGGWLPAALRIRSHRASQLLLGG